MRLRVRQCWPARPPRGRKSNAAGVFGASVLIREAKHFLRSGVVRAIAFVRGALAYQRRSLDGRQRTHGAISPWTKSHWHGRREKKRGARVGSRVTPAHGSRSWVRGFHLCFGQKLTREL